MGAGGCRPGNASCQTVQHVQHVSFSTYSSTEQSPCPPPFHRQDDRTAHILRQDDRYVISLKSLFVFRRCMSPFILPADSAHGTFPHSFCPIVIWHADAIKGGDLSHAIMAENKGDEVCRTKGKQGIKRAGMKADYNKGRSFHPLDATIAGCHQTGTETERLLKMRPRLSFALFVGAQSCINRLTGFVSAQNDDFNLQDLLKETDTCDKVFFLLFRIIM